MEGKNEAVVIGRKPQIAVGISKLPASLTSIPSNDEFPVENFIKQHKLVFCASIGTAVEAAQETLMDDIAFPHDSTI